MFEKNKILILLLIIVCCFSKNIYCQDTLSTKKTETPKHHSISAATLMSTFIPGLGQVYNKKYWKPPIIYLAMGTTIHLFFTNNTLYKQYHQAYIYKTDTARATIDNYPKESAEQLLGLSDNYRRYRDLNVILTVLMYTLNVVDAYVDAHLMTFDISDNLSMSVYPNLQLATRKERPAMGLTFSFTF